MTRLTFYGQSRAWWLILAIGILFIIGGFAYWVWPAAGYAEASQLFGWLLVVTGVVQVCASASGNRPAGWGWWLAGGIINMFIGFMLVRSVLLSEAVFPYFMAFFFFYWGIESLVSAASRRRRYWVLGIINGILELILGYFFLESSIVSVAFMTSFLVSIAFIYWGFTITIVGIELKPVSVDR